MLDEKPAAQTLEKHQEEEASEAPELLKTTIKVEECPSLPDSATSAGTTSAELLNEHSHEEANKLMMLTKKAQACRADVDRMLQSNEKMEGQIEKLAEKVLAMEEQEKNKSDKVLQLELKFKQEAEQLAGKVMAMEEEEKNKSEKVERLELQFKKDAELLAEKVLAMEEQEKNKADKVQQLELKFKKETGEQQKTIIKLMAETDRVQQLELKLANKDATQQQTIVKLMADLAAQKDVADGLQTSSLEYQSQLEKAREQELMISSLTVDLASKQAQIAGLEARLRSRQERCKRRFGKLKTIGNMLRSTSANDERYLN